MKNLLFMLLSLLLGGNIVSHAQNLDAMSMEALDTMYSNLNKKGKSADALPYILKLAEKTAAKFGKQDTAYATRLRQIGITYHNLGNYTKSVQMAQEALSIIERRVGKNNDNYAKNLMNLAVYFEKLQKIDEALLKYNEVKSIMEQIPDGKKNIIYAQLLTNFGVVYSKLDRLDLTVKYYKDALLAYEQISGTESPEYLLAYGNLGTTYRMQGRVAEAEKILKDVVIRTAKVQGKEHPSYFRTLEAMALFYKQTANFAKAEEYYKMAIEGQKKVEGEGGIYHYSALQQLGFLYFAWARYDDAENVFLLSREIAIKKYGKEHRFYPISLSDLGTVYWKDERYAEAEPLYLEALAIYTKINMKGSNYYNSVVHNLALLYKTVKRYKEAEKLYLESIEGGLSSEGNTSNKLQAINNLAALYIDGELDYAKAEPLCKTAVAEAEKLFGKEHPKYAEYLANYAALNDKQKRYDESEKKFVQAYSIYLKNLSPRSKEALMTVNSLAAVNIAVNDSVDAARYIWQAIGDNAGKDKVPTNIDDNWLKELSGYDYANYSELDRSLKALLLFLKKYNYSKQKQSLVSELALNIFQKVHQSYISEEDKLRVLRLNSYWSNKSVSSNFEMGGDENLYKAFEAAELGKAILLSENTQANQAYISGVLPDSLLSLEQFYQAELARLNGEIVQAKSDSSKQKLYEKFSDYNLKIKALKESISKNYPKYDQLKSLQKNVSIKELQALLDDKTTVLEYVVTDSFIYAFAISKSAFKAKAVPLTRTELSQKVRDFRKALSDYSFIKESKKEAYTLFTETAHWFYSSLLAPVLDKKDGVLLIIPDSELGHLPFETFLTAAAPATENYATLPYLLNKYAVYYNYSASLFKENISNSKTAKNNGKMMAIAASYSPSKQTATSRSGLGRLRKDLLPLPEAAKEVEALSKNLAGKFYFNDDATEKNFKLEASQYQVIHLAMHGILNKKNTFLSSLVFTENGDSTEDNFLQAFEISHLKLNAQLVVLSACETGYGKVQQGEGVMSLARSFMYAGVPSLVVSMWQVNDGSTSTIMQAFYKNLAKGMNKSEALRQAKLAYIKMAGDGNDANNSISTNSNHPAFWAPFVIIGDDRPISLATKNGGLLWWVAGGIGLLALGGAVFALRRRKENS